MNDITERLQECADNFPVIEDNPYSVFVDAKAEITRLQAENEALRARVAELEAVIPSHIIRAHKQAEVCWEAFDHLEQAMASPAVIKFVLRKQAEAVEAFAQHIKENHAEVMAVWILQDAEQYIQRLLDQATAIERQSEGGDKSC